MAIKQPLVLPADVILTPVAQLPESVREKLAGEEGDYAITRPRSRMPSKIIDSQAAELLKEFKTPKTIIQAVINHSRSQQLDPEQALEETFPLLENLISSQLLVLADSEEATRIEPSFAVGEQIAGFEILECIQVLEDTELYQVKNNNGELAALKILRPSPNPQTQPMLEREAAILKHLDGSVNPRLWETGTFADRPYLLLEWCPGDNAAEAAEVLCRYSSTENRQQLLRLCVSILEAYSHLHAQQVIHGDVHPRNLLVTSEGSVKIIDYGLARLESSESELGEPYRGGIGFFFEPEYARSYFSRRKPPNSSRLGEQYALAALLYFLLTGAHYLEFSPEKHQMLQQIAEDSPLPFSRRGMKPWLEVEKILTKALQKEPSERFPSLAEFANQLKQVTVEEEPNSPILVESVKPADYTAAKELLNQVLQRVGLSGSLLSDGLTTAPTRSVNYGAAGIAYALYRIACIQEDAALLSLADIWATKAASDLANPKAFYNSEIEITPETVGQISPYHTASGVHCTQAFISHAMGDIVSQQAAIEAFVSASKAPCENLDLTLGRSSTLLACSLLLDTIADNEWIDSTPLLELGDEVMAEIWDKLNTFAPIQDCSKITFSGIAHGWAGLLYATMRWCQSAERVLPSQLEERLQQLAEYAEPVGRGVRWKWNIRRQSGDRTGNYMPGWCNGSAGFVFLWTLAHQVLSDEAYLTLAEKTAWNTWEEPDSIGNLCCGLAGRAYGLLNLYKHTGKSNWLYRAQELTNRAALSTKALALTGDSLYKAVGLRPDSLYKGDVGVAVLAADLSKPETSCMPFFEPER